MKNLLNKRVALTILLGSLLVIGLTVVGVGQNSKYLKGTYTLTFLGMKLPCHFNADTLSNEIEGSLICSQVQLPLEVKGEKVLQGDSVYGVWEHEEGNKYFLSAARLYYKEEDLSYGGRGVAGGIVTKEGDVLTGTFNIKIEGPDGKALRRQKSDVRFEKQTREGLEVKPPTDSE